MENDLKNKKVVIMGGTLGMGFAAAKLFMQNGADVTITSYDQKQLTDAAQELQGITTACVNGRVVKEVHEFFANHEYIDHLIIAFGSSAGMGTFRTLDINEVRRGFEEKFFAHLDILQAALPVMRPEGSVTFITAATARTAFAGTSGLGAANGAMEAIIPTLALELQPLRINAVSPGITDTHWWDVVPEAERKATFEGAARMLPVHHIGKPEDIAKAIIFLASDTYVTGTILECDGGVRIK